jgi:hypothetical protein
MLWALLVLSSPDASFALTVRTLTLEELVASARSIFVGRCVSVREVESSQSGLPAIEAVFAVEESLRSDAAARDPAAGPHGGSAADPPGYLTIRQFGGRRAPGLGATFVPGREMLLFLHGRNAAGLASPVGMAQGAFTIVRRPPEGGPDLAVRSAAVLGSARFPGLPRRAAHGTEPAAGPGASPAVELEALLAAVRQLVRETRP